MPAPDAYQLPGSSATLGNPGGERCGDGVTVTLEYALQVSCNTPFAILGVEIGDDALRAQAEAFGWGQDLEIPLVVTPSIFPADPDAAQTAMSAIGQFDVRATPDPDGDGLGRRRERRRPHAPVPHGDHAGTRTSRSSTRPSRPSSPHR